MTTRDSIRTLRLWLRAGLLLGIGLSLTAALGTTQQSAVRADFEIKCWSESSGEGYYGFTCRCPGTLAPCVWNCYGEAFTPYCNRTGIEDECDELILLFDYYEEEPEWDCYPVDQNCCGMGNPPCQDYNPGDVWVYCNEYCMLCN